jgi:cytidyltransferase-like protein
MNDMALQTNLDYFVPYEDRLLSTEGSRKMKQKMLMPWFNPNVNIVMCGAAAAVCMYSLFQIRACPKTLGESSPSISVGLLRLSHPHDNFLHVLQNDVLVEKSIEKVNVRLYVYVDDGAKYDMSTSARLKYMGDLYNLLWDFACYYGKYDLDIRIISCVDRPWEDVLRIPELNGVLAYDGLDVIQLNQDRNNEQRVVFYPLKPFVARQVNPSMFSYLEDEHTTVEKEDVVVVGGTFDHLHNGHKKLLSLAATVCNIELIVGVTAPHMLEKKKLNYLIETLEIRKRKVTEYLTCIRPGLALDVIAIDDPFGPAITSSVISGIIVSTETIAGAMKINDIRRERDLKPLKIYVCRRTECSTLSSTFIREQQARRR